MTSSSRARRLVLTFCASGAAAAAGAAGVQAQQPASPPVVERPSTQPATQPSGGPPPQFIVVSPDGSGRWGASNGMMVRSSAVPFGTSYGYGNRPPAPFEPGEVAQRASWVLQIDASPGREPGLSIGMDPNTVVGLLNSSAVIDAAVREVLKLEPDRQREAVALTAYATGPRFAHVEVWLKKGTEFKPDAAGALMTAAVERLRAAVAESVQAQRQAIDERRAALEKELVETRERMSGNQKKIREYRKISGTFGGYGDPSSAVANLRQQRQQSEAELARLRARLKAVDPEAGSPLTAELEEIVRLRQQQLDETRKLAETKAASRQDVTERELKVAEAKAQLAAQQRALATAGESSRRSHSAQEASSLRAQVAEYETRLKQSDDQIAKLEDETFQALAAQYPELQQEENRLRSQVMEVTNRMESFRRTSQYDADVRITILDGAPDAPARPANP